MTSIDRISARLAAAVLALAASWQSAPGLAADAVALVTDLQGRASISVAGKKSGVAILAEVPEGAQIELRGGARLVAVFLKSGEEYSFPGPTAARFAAAGPRIESGPAPVRRPSALEKGKDIRIRAVGVTQAAIVMRSTKPGQRIRLMNLNGTKTLDAQPEFRWQPIAGMRRYRFELADASGKALVELDIEGDTYRLPATIRLEEGATYTWEVSTRLPDGRKYATAGDFSLLPSVGRAEVEALRPAPTAPVSERVAFAAWLMQQELRDEARKYWRDAAAERPEDERLKQLAGE